MRIKVEESGKRAINICIPSGIVFNPIVATIGCGIANKSLSQNSKTKEINLTPKQMRALFKALNEASKILKRDGLPLVEVTSSDGESVKVIL